MITIVSLHNVHSLCTIGKNIINFSEKQYYRKGDLYYMTFDKKAKQFDNLKI